MCFKKSLFVIPIVMGFFPPISNIKLLLSVFLTFVSCWNEMSFFSDVEKY